MTDTKIADDVRNAIVAVMLPVSAAEPDSTSAKLTFSDIQNGKVISIEVRIEIEEAAPF